MRAKNCRSTAEIAGPAILEQMDATTVMEPGDRGRSDSDGNLIIEVGGQPEP